MSLVSAAGALAFAACHRGSESASSAGPDGALGARRDKAPDAGAGTGSDGGASVVQHHKSPTRDGVFVDAALSRAAVATMRPDTAFAPRIEGPTYAQPLFIDGAIDDKDALIVATERNVVHALDASTGAPIWTARLLSPAPRSALPCGNIDPLGITGTPYADLTSRTLYFDAMTATDGTQKHLVYALSLDDGSVRPGWPVDLGAKIPSFRARDQNQRGAVLVQGGILYVPFGGHFGDCGDYHGWLVGVDVNNPAIVRSWETPAAKGGAWSAAGVSTDGAKLYITTGNTADTNGTWGGGDAVLRFDSGPVFSNATADYFAPRNWLSLDGNDDDMATHALLHAPGVTPSELVAAFGKDGNIYLLDRASLGGIGGELSVFRAAAGEIMGAATTYTTPAGTFIAFRVSGGQPAACPNGQHGNMGAVRVVPGARPTLQAIWCANERDQSVPITSMTDASGANAIVWNMGAHLYAYDAETGTELFAGGDLSGTRYFNTPIVAKGRVYVPADATVYSFAPQP